MTLPAAIEPPPHTNIGEVIRTQREALHMTQAELALAVGVSPRTVGSYERGAVEPSLGLLLRIGRALRVRFVDDGAGRYEALPLDAAPDPAPAPPQVVVIVAATAEAMREALDRAGVPRAD